MTDAVDLTTLGGAAVAASVSPSPPGERPYDPARDREKVRGQIAMLLLWTLVGLVAALALIGIGTAFWCMWQGAQCSADVVELKTVSTLVTLIVTPIIGLVGAVTGFYFGEKSGGNGRSG